MPRTAPPTPDRYQGFSLKSVCWGYQEVFAQAIEGLFAEGALGPHREAATRQFFAVLKRADKSCFDEVLREFLGALNPRTRWLLDLPGVFSDVTELGAALAERRIFYGTAFFRLLGEGGLGDSPAAIRQMVTITRRLLETDNELAFAFLKGYARLRDRLTPPELEQFVALGRQIHARDPRAAIGFFDGTAKSGENVILGLTRECRLPDVQADLTALLRALTGADLEIADLGQLDADELIARGAGVVCLYRWLYVPVRVRHLTSAALNRDWYRLIAVTTAGLLAENSFCRIHGHPDYPTCAGLVGAGILEQNLFTIIEYARVLRRIRAHWPGARRLLDFGLAAEFRHAPAVTPPDRLLHALLHDADLPGPAQAELRRIVHTAVNCFATATWVRAADHAAILAVWPGLDRHLVRPVAFLPDFQYPGTVSSPPTDSLVADLKDAADRAHPQREDEDDDEPPPLLTPQDGDGEGADEKAAEGAVAAAFVYDEWSHADNDYLTGWCLLREGVPDTTATVTMPADVAAAARRVRQVFESLKPEVMSKEKYLDAGDVINPDLLVAHLVERRVNPAPPIRFYERPHINRRDLAVLVLLDASGSTAEKSGDRKVIDLERHAALILGEGLAALGDRFEIAGFNSNGRQACQYVVYKSTADPWDRAATDRLLAVRPGNATRMGAALRHAGWRLAKIEARQRLIILITDGKPMDSDYDPNTRHAQFDVRMACEENERHDIRTFAISTEENSYADMEIMFPGRRFAILDDMRDLPQLLPRLYLRLTV